jgi:hypothetical protein
MHARLVDRMKEANQRGGEASKAKALNQTSALVAGKGEPSRSPACGDVPCFQSTHIPSNSYTGYSELGSKVTAKWREKAEGDDTGDHLSPSPRAIAQNTPP